MFRLWNWKWHHSVLLGVVIRHLTVVVFPHLRKSFLRIFHVHHKTFWVWHGWGSDWGIRFILKLEYLVFNFKVEEALVILLQQEQGVFSCGSFRNRTVYFRSRTVEHSGCKFFMFRLWNWKWHHSVLLGVVIRHLTVVVFPHLRKSFLRIFHVHHKTFWVWHGWGSDWGIRFILKLEYLVFNFKVEEALVILLQQEQGAFSCGSFLRWWWVTLGCLPMCSQSRCRDVRFATTATDEGPFIVVEALMQR